VQLRKVICNQLAQATCFTAHFLLTPATKIILARPLLYHLSSTIRPQTIPYAFSLSKETAMTATAARFECIPNTLHTTTLQATIDAPTLMARQREIAANGAALNQVSRRYQFLMSFLRILGTCNA
jgi:hypothetical protein